MPEALFEQLLAETEDRNGAAYEAIIEAEASWT